MNCYADTLIINAWNKDVLSSQGGHTDYPLHNQFGSPNPLYKVSYTKGIRGLLFYWKIVKKNVIFIRNDP